MTGLNYNESKAKLYSSDPGDLFFAFSVSTFSLNIVLVLQ